MVGVGSFRGGADIGIEGLIWRPARRRTPVFDHLDLKISAGERVLVTGPSGAGKSTLLRALAGLLLTDGEGELSGRVTIGGPQAVELVGSTSPVGLLLQDPTAGIVAETVGRDVAFGLENRRVSREAIACRVTDALEAVRFPYGPGHLTAALSGGESQRLMLAGVLVLGAPVLLLDEPTSMLDPAAASSVRTLLQDSIRSRGCTTVIVEHHIEPWLQFADRLIVLGADGALLADGSPDSVLAQQAEALATSGVWLPGAHPPKLLDIDSALTTPLRACEGDLICADDVGVELRRRIGGGSAAMTRALDSVSATLLSGLALAVTGPSGAGKSTLTAVLAGLQRPTTGSVRCSPALATRSGAEPWRWRSRDLADRLAWVPQLPEHGVVASSVLDEVLATSRACGRHPAAAHRRARGLLEVLSLASLADASPYHLSGGEQRRLMVAAALAAGPAGLLLDEPTVGQDRHTWSAVLGAVGSARDAGAAVALSTHDELAVACVADAQLRLDHGRVSA